MENSIMFTIQSWYILLPVFLLLVIKFILSKNSIGRKFLWITFSIYILCVIHLVFFPIEVNIGKYANLTPWYKSINFIPILTIDLKTFILNIIMLIPFGIYAPLLNRQINSIKKIAKQGFFFSLALECTQLLIRITLGSGRSTDINDLMANTLGAVIGFIIITKLLQNQTWKNILKWVE